MAKFAVPVIIYVEADSYDDAHKMVSEWGDEVNPDELFDGIDNIDCNPIYDHDDDGQRVIYLPSEEDEDDDYDDDDLNEIDEEGLDEIDEKE